MQTDEGAERQAEVTTVEPCKGPPAARSSEPGDAGEQNAEAVAQLLGMHGANVAGDMTSFDAPGNALAPRTAVAELVPAEQAVRGATVAHGVETGVASTSLTTGADQPRGGVSVKEEEEEREQGDREKIFSLPTAASN